MLHILVTHTHNTHCSYREQISLAQGRLSSKTSELLDCQREASMVMNQAQDIESKTQSLTMELENLKAQKVTLEAEKKTTEEQRDQAQMQARALSSYAGLA